MAGPGGWVPAANREAFWRSIREAVGSATLRVERSGLVLEERVPISEPSQGDRSKSLWAAFAAAAATLGFALRVYWKSSAPAAPAVLLLLSLVGADLVSILCWPYAESVRWAGGALDPLVCAALAHLALTYPRSVPLLGQAPRLAAIPYFLAASLAAVALRGLRGEATLWLLGERFVLALGVAATVLLIVTALRAAAARGAPLERARGRLLLAGTGGIALALAAIHLGWGAEIPGGHATPVAAGMVIFATPLGFSITRYDLFDLPLRARRALDLVLRIGGLGALTAGAISALQALTGLSGPGIWMGGAITAYAVGHLFHHQIHGLVEHVLAPEVERRRQLLLDHERRVARLVTDDMAARLVGRTLEAGLAGSGVAVFFKDGDRWRLVHCGRGAPISRRSLASAGAALLGERTSLHLARGDIPQGPDA